MELLHEIWESDLLFLGIGVMLISVVLPLKDRRANYCGILFCFGTYILSELIISLFHPAFLITILALFISCIALFAAIGRLMRLLCQNLKR